MNSGLERAVQEVRSADLSDPLEDVVDLARVRDAVDLRIAEAMRVISDNDLLRGESPIAHLRYAAHLSTGSALAANEVGGALDQLPLSAAALEAGEIGFSHLALMASAWHQLGDAFDEPKLLKKAKELPVTQFRRAVEHAVHAAHPERFVEQEREGREGRFLKLSPTENGSLWLKGWLEPEGASLVRSALEAVARPGPGEDYRTRNQRLGDALVEIAGQGVTTELVVTVPIETLAAVRGAPAAETEWGALLSSEIVRRLACDSPLRRLVLDGAGLVLDYGRRRRLFSGVAKRAMSARDRHCQFPRCDRPARWCEGHHAVAYSEGGATAVNEGVLLCRRHHHLVHEDGWRLVKESQRWVAIPPRVDDWEWPPPIAA